MRCRPRASQVRACRDRPQCAAVTLRKSFFTPAASPATCYRKQQIMVTRNRRYNADSSLAVLAPHCQNSRSVASSVVLVPTVHRALQHSSGHVRGDALGLQARGSIVTARARRRSKRASPRRRRARRARWEWSSWAPSSPRTTCASPRPLAPSPPSLPRPSRARVPPCLVAAAIAKKEILMAIF